MQARVQMFNRAPQARNWYSIKAESRAAELLIYDEISDWGVSAHGVASEISQLDVESITVRINSPGGNVFDGIAIYNALRSHPARVNTRIEGLAASIASVIAMAGETVEIAESAWMMIHEAWAVAIGPADELRDTADLLERLNGTLVDIYHRASGGLDRDDIADMMAGETWLDARSSVIAGFAHSVYDDDTDEDAAARFDLSVYSKVPDSLCGTQSDSETPTVRDVERCLRDAGVSREQAKALARRYGKASESTPRDASDDDAAELLQQLNRRLRGTAS